jgi:DNA-binding beta-propeller fold protein YncE
VAVDPAGNLYIADQYNARIRRVDASTGIITTFAGNGQHGDWGDGGAAIVARLHDPAGVALDYAGNLYIADIYNGRIRRVDTSTSIITTVAGNGESGYSGDGWLATQAQLDLPMGVAVDLGGNLYIADVGNRRIRQVGGAIITTVAGGGWPGIR